MRSFISVSGNLADWLVGGELYELNECERELNE